MQCYSAWSSALPISSLRYQWYIYNSEKSRKFRRRPHLERRRSLVLISLLQGNNDNPLFFRQCVQGLYKIPAGNVITRWLVAFSGSKTSSYQLISTVSTRFTDCTIQYWLIFPRKSSYNYTDGTSRRPFTVATEVENKFSFIIEWNDWNLYSILCRTIQ